MLIKDIANAIAGRIDGDGAIEVNRLVHPLQANRSTDLALAISPDAVLALSHSKARAVVVSAERAAPAGSYLAVIAVKEPRLALAKLTALFDQGPAHNEGVHSSAIVASDAELGSGVNVGAYAVIGPRSRIGNGTTIMSQTTIGADVTIGAQNLIYSGVRIGDGVNIGDRVIIHANAVIGSDGFSFAPGLNSPQAFSAGTKLTRIHSLGSVVIGDDVEIGAGTTIDRSTLETTRIGRGTKIDNQVHIGHNVSIGESCVLCGKVGISGSVSVGDRVRFGGGVGVADHVRIGDEAVIVAGSGVVSNVAAGAFVSGNPAIAHQRNVEQIQYLWRQKRLHSQVEDISKRIEAVENLIRK